MSRNPFLDVDLSMEPVPQEQAEQEKKVDLGMEPCPGYDPATTKAVTSQSASLSPETAAADFALSKQFGQPVGLVSRNRELFKDKALTGAVEQTLSTAPALRGLYNSGSTQAALLREDLDNAAQLETLTGLLGGASAELRAGRAERSADAAQSGFWDTVMRGGGSIAQGGADIARWYTGLTQMIYDGLHNLTGAEFFKRTSDYAAASTEELFKLQEKHEPSYGGVLKFVHDVERTLPALGVQAILTVLTGGVGAGAVTMSAGSAAGQYGEERRAGVPAGRALAASSANAVVQAPLYMLSFGKLFNLTRVPAQAVGRAMGEAVAANAGGNFLGYFPDAYSRLWAEAEKEGRGERGTWRYFLDNMDAHLREAGYSAALGVPVALTGGGGRLVYEVGRQRALGRDRAVFSALDESAKASKLRARLPEAYQNLAAHLTRGGPVENLYIAPEALRTVAGNEGELYQLADKLGVSKEQFERAETLGADLEVPLANYQAHVAGTETSLRLRDHLRTAPDAMTPAEAVEFQKNFQAEAQRLLQQAETHAAGRQELEEVLAPIGEQLSAVYGKGAVDANLALLRARAQTASAAWRAAGEDISPAQWLRDKIGLRVESGGREGMDNGRALYQPGDQNAASMSKPLPVRFADMPAVEADSSRWFGEGKAIGADKRNLRKSLKEWAKENFSKDTAVSNADTGWQVQVTPRGVSNSLSHGFGDRLARSVPFVPQIIESGIHLDSIEKKPGLMSHIFANKIRLDGKDYVVGFVLREDRTGNRFYDHELTEIIDPGSLILSRDTSKEALGHETRANRGDVMNILREKLGVNDGSGQVLFHAADGDTAKARGSIRFGDGETVIRAFRDSADISTLPHELGHLFVHDMEELVKTGHAPEQLVADLRSLEKFTAEFDDPAALKAFYDASYAPAREAFRGKAFESLSEAEQGHVRYTAGQEKLVDAFVSYLKEGKAPSPELRSAFRRFRDWLTGLYRSLRDQGVEINPEVRGVFDRMLASEEDIAVADSLHQADQAEFAAMNKVALEMLTEAEQRRLEAARRRAVETSVEERTRKSLKAFYESLLEKKKLLAEAREQVNAMPVYAAQDEALRLGGIAHADVLEQFGERTVRALLKKRPGLLRKEGGIPLHDLAVAFDFADAEALVDAVLAAPGKGKETAALAAHAREAKEAALREKLGMDRGAIPGEEDYYNNERLKALLLEARALGRKASGPGRRAPGTAQEARRLAGTLLDAMPRREAVNISRLSAAEARAAADAVRKLNSGEAGEAADAKRKQIIAHALVLEALDAREQAQKFDRALRRYARSDKMEFAHQEQILALAARYGLGGKGRYNPRKPDELRPLREFIEDATADSIFEAPPFADFILSETVPEHMTFGQLREVWDVARWLAEEGQPGEARLITEGMEGTVDAAAHLGAETLENSGNSFSFREEGTLLRKIQDGWKDLFTGLDHIKFIMMGADGYREIGAKGSHRAGFHSRLFQRVMDAQNENSRLFREARPELDRIGAIRGEFLRRFAKEFGERAPQINGVPTPEVMKNVGRNNWTAEHIWCLARNMGNAGNLKTLYNGYGLSDAQLHALTSILTREEWLAVQAEGDLLGRDYERTDAVFRKIYGRPMPEKVEPQPLRVLTAEGQELDLPGWYFPISVDSKLSPEIGDKQSVDMVQATPEFTAFGPALSRGHTKTRTGTGKPVGLYFGVFDGALWDQWRFLTHAPIIRDVDRISRNKEWRKAFTEAFGPQQYDELRAWLKYTARPVTGRGDRPDAFLNNQRKLATVFALGLNTNTFIRQFSGYFQALPDLGASWILRGMGRAAHNPLALVRQVNETSLFMADRDKNFVRELRKETLRQTTGLKVSIGGHVFTGADIQEASMSLVALGDRLTSYPIWQGAYIKAVEHLNLNQKDAVAYADGIVQKTQASNSVADVNRWQREDGKSWKRLFSMFMSEALRKGSRMRYWYHSFRLGRVGVGEYVNHLLMESVAPALFYVGMRSLLTSTPPDSEDVAEQVWNEAMGPLPLISQLSSVFSYGGSMSKSPAFRGVEALEKSLRSGKKYLNNPGSTEAQAAFFKSLVDVAAYSAGAGNVRRVYETAAEGWEDLEMGRTQNPFRLFFRKPKD